MAKPIAITNEVRAYRVLQGWSQQDLATRCGLSRAGIGAIEAGRLVPSTAAALTLALALSCRVDDLFRLQTHGTPQEPQWAWSPTQHSGRYWHALIGGRTVLYPVEASLLGAIPHDGTFCRGVIERSDRADPSKTLVLACCDPAVGLLAEELARSSGIRLLVLSRSSRTALELLKAGVVHAAGVHLVAAGELGNQQAVCEVVGTGYTLLRLARWEEGIAFAPSRRLASTAAAVGANLRWIGREPGSGARQCLDELLDGRQPVKKFAADHRGVAEAIRSGWADLGVCLRLTAEEAGLNFLGLRQESYDLCFATELENDPRIRALVAAARSLSYRRTIGELPGYANPNTGELSQV